MLLRTSYHHSAESRSKMLEVPAMLGHRPNSVALENAQTPQAKAKRQATRDAKGLNSTAGTLAAVQAARDPDVIKRRVATRRATGHFGPDRKFNPSKEE